MATQERKGGGVWTGLALTMLVAAAPLSATRVEVSPGLTYGMVEAIARDIRTGPLGQGGVFFGDVRTPVDARTVLRTLGLSVADLWWLPDADGDGSIDHADAALMMRYLGGYAEGVTPDRITRAFAKSGLVIGITEVAEPSDDTFAATHHKFFSDQWVHGVARSKDERFWPPNHHRDVSYGWGTHSKEISQTWPPSHGGSYSRTWPPVHQASISQNVPPNHDGSISKDWPIESHTQALSRVWPPGHLKTVSPHWPKDHTMQRSLQDNPSPHQEVYSKTWPSGHDKARSEQVWPPNHDGNISLTWNDHDLSISKKNWPPSHRSDISKTWKDGESWPPNHHSEVSATWSTPSATPSPEAPAPGTVQLN